MSQTGRECDLKYLGFFPAALASACLYLSAIYEAAKDQAGPLKPGVEDVEEVLRIVLKPVIRIAEDHSKKLLDYVDKKVDEKLKIVDEHIPPFIKPFAFHAQRWIVGAEPTMLLSVRSLEFDSPASSHCVSYDKEAFPECRPSNAVVKFISVLHLQAIMRVLGPRAVYSAQLFNSFTSSLREAHVPFCCHIPELPVHLLEQALEVSSTENTWQTWQMYQL
ncbi:hypothetical protein KP509_31G028800 [Ceratopteris richardii]|uniref:Uncharacterized protein n=1 Tax=Ceratopteris richardii TaxID=49495 RepID=A0A8T2QYN4_CERRI|nr:hypothetical protein KP509_31G028800 [Ceratopteris richardii]KAH7288505.1 hypothetical protein KP509_31G028800 [Ceratopteris richardii]